MNVEFFKIELNSLNNDWMVFSNCQQLVQCYNGGSKKNAQKLADDLNIIANADFKKYFNADLSKISFKN